MPEERQMRLEDKRVAESTRRGGETHSRNVRKIAAHQLLSECMQIYSYRAYDTISYKVNEKDF